MQEQLWFMNTLVTVHVGQHDGDDDLSVLESLAPRGDSPPLHVHRDEDEVFHVLDGEFRFRVGESEVTASPGQTLLAPKGVPHTYRVESERGRCLVTTARGDFERFVRSVSRPAEHGDLPEPAGPPTSEEQQTLAEACRAHGIELVGAPLR